MLARYPGLTLLCVALCVGAASALEPVAVRPGVGRYGLGSQVEELEDRDGLWTLSDVRAAPLAERFAPSRREEPSFGVTRSAWWLRFALRNEDARPQEQLLVMDWALTDSLDLHAPDGAGAYREIRAGDQLPFRARSSDYRKPVFRLTLAPGTTEIFYLRVQGEDALVVPLSLWTEHGFSEARLRENAAKGFYYGLMTVILLYNAVYFVVLRERSYLYMTLAFLGVVAWQLSLDGFPAQFLFPDHPWWAHRAVGFTGMFAGIALIAFIRSFLETAARTPRIDLTLRAIMALGGAALLSCFVNLRLVNAVAVPLSAFVPLSIWAAPRSWRAGYTPVRDFLVALTPFLLALFVWGVESTYGVVQSTVLSTWALPAGAIATTALLSVAMTSRVNRLREDRDRAQTLVQASRRLALYFPRKLVERIMSSDEEVSLASERRNITIFFSDLTGFTSLTDSNEPERVSRVLNQYLTGMMRLIEEHGGTLDKVMGDGIVGFFGAPDEMPEAEQARRAVSMAVAMQKHMKQLGQAWLDEGLDHDVRIRIGIHQEYVTVGNFGSQDLMSYTAIGGGVNLASRLETGCTPGMVAVSYPVYAKTRDLFPYGPLREREFKGFTRSHRVCELDPAQVADPA